MAAKVSGHTTRVVRPLGENLNKPAKSSTLRCQKMCCPPLTGAAMQPGYEGACMQVLDLPVLHEDFCVYPLSFVGDLSEQSSLAG